MFLNSKVEPTVYPSATKFACGFSDKLAAGLNSTYVPPYTVMLKPVVSFKFNVNPNSLLGSPFITLFLYFFKGCGSGAFNLLPAPDSSLAYNSCPEGI